MKLIVTGGRNYVMTCAGREALSSIVDCFSIDEIVTGGCRGADQAAEDWAKQRGLKVTTFRANWKIGKSAGPKRNSEMIKYCIKGICLAFPGGKGTADMLHKAEMAGLQIIIHKGEP